MATARVKGWLHQLEYLEKWLLLGVVVGVASGFFAYGFYQLLEYATGVALFLLGVEHQIKPAHDIAVELIVKGVTPLLAPVVVMLGALVSALLVYTFAPEAEGHGTDAAVNAFHRRAGVILFRVPVVKALASAATIGFGGSGGIEGPSVQMGAGIGSTVARLLHLSPEDRRIALVSGMAAALSVLFHAPLGSALFAIEVLYRRDLEARAFIPAFIASIVAFSVTCPLTGFKPLLPRLAADPVALYSLPGMLSLILLGFYTAPFAFLYVKSFYIVKDAFDRLFKRYRVTVYLKPVAGGAIAGVLGMLIPHILGPGRGVARFFLEEMQNGNPSFFVVAGLPLWASLLLIALAKIAATSFSIGSGGSGGVFAPGLLAGALVGASFGLLLGSRIAPIDPTVYAYLGMAAFFGAAGKVPLAVSVMVSEMGGNYLLIPPALLSACIARLLTGEATIYESQLERRLPSELINAETLYELLARSGHRVKLRVEDIVDRSIHPVREDEPLERVLERLRRLRTRVLPVVDREGRPIGVVDLSDLNLLARLAEEDPNMRISSLRLPPPPTISANQTLDEALARMLRLGVDYLLVVSPTGVYQGVVRAEDIASMVAYLLHELRNGVRSLPRGAAVVSKSPGAPARS